jgi:hypothetical protein
MFEDEQLLMAIQQIARIKHLQLLMQLEKEGITITDKIDSNLPKVIGWEAGFYLDDYGSSTLERVIDLHKENNV